MVQRIEKLEQQGAELLEAHQQLLERINKTSKNSSSPPSSDPPGFGQKSTKGWEHFCGANAYCGYDSQISATIGSWIL